MKVRTHLSKKVGKELIAWKCCGGSPGVTGKKGIHLENTAPAVEGVLKSRVFTRIEMDTRITADGVLIAYHSPTLRLHGLDKSVHELDWKFLRKFKLRGGYRIPKVLDILKDFPFNYLLHVKRENPIDPYLDVLNKFPYPVQFHSNSKEHLKAVSKHENTDGVFKGAYSPEPRILKYVKGYLLYTGINGKAKANLNLGDEWLSRLKKFDKTVYVVCHNSKEWIQRVCDIEKVDGFLTARSDRILGGN